MDTHIHRVYIFPCHFSSTHKVLIFILCGPKGTSCEQLVIYVRVLQDKLHVCIQLSRQNQIAAGIKRAIQPATAGCIELQRVQIAELGTRSFFPGLLSAQFLPMDCYRSIAHFADFQVCSMLNRSLKDQWFALGKSTKMLNRF